MTVHQVGSEESAEFEAWFAVAQEPLMRAMTVLTGSRPVAEDIAAEAFARAWARWPRVARMPHRDAWLHRVARNLALSRFRRLDTRRRWLSRQRRVDAGPSPERDQDLWQAVQALPERRRTAIALRYVADLSIEQIATAMGISSGTVTATLHAAKKQLLDTYGPQEEGSTVGNSRA